MRWVINILVSIFNRSGDHRDHYVFLKNIYMYSYADYYLEG